MIDNIAPLLGDKAEYLLKHTCKTVSTKLLHLPGPDWVDRIFGPSNRNQRVLNQPQPDVSSGPPGWHRLPFHPAGGSGHRTFRRRELREEPALLRSREHREAGHRRRLQRRRLDFRRAGSRRAQIRAQDSLPREDQSQRTADLPEQARSNHVRHGRRRPTTWARRRSARPSISARKTRRARSSRSRKPSRRRTSLGMATVLWCYLRNNAFKKDKDYHVSADLTGQANHLGVHDPGGHHQAKTPGEQRRLQGAEHGRFELRQARRAHLHRTDERSSDRPVPLPGGQLLSWAAPA